MANPEFKACLLAACVFAVTIATTIDNTTIGVVTNCEAEKDNPDGHHHGMVTTPWHFEVPTAYSVPHPRPMKLPIWYARHRSIKHDFLTNSSKCHRLVETAAYEKEIHSYSSKLDTYNCVTTVTSNVGVHFRFGDNTFFILRETDIWSVTHYSKHLKVILQATCDTQPNSMVVLIRSDVDISELDDFEDTRMCFSSINSVKHYKQVLFKLHELFKPHFSKDRSNLENEVYALSQVLKAACLPGRWHHNDTRDKALKRKYPSLCALCADQSNPCSDKDVGEENAARCIVQNKADVHFCGIYTRNEIRDNPKKFMSTVQSRAASATDVKSNLRLLTINYDTLPFDESNTFYLFAFASWMIASFPVLVQDVYTDESYRLSLVTDFWDYQWQYIAKHASDLWYKEVMEAPNFRYRYTPVCLHYNCVIDDHKVFPGRHFLDFMSHNTSQLRVCHTTMAYATRLRITEAGRQIGARYTFWSVHRDTMLQCLEAVRRREADAMVVKMQDRAQIMASSTNFRVLLLDEAFDRDTIAVAVVRRDSYYRDLESLRGVRSCHPFFGSLAGWQLPIAHFIRKGIMQKPTCPVLSPAESLAQFFSNGSCVPGAIAGERAAVKAAGQSRVTPFRASALCSQCLDSCEADHTERLNGHEGAIRCLDRFRGDIAFVVPGIVESYIDASRRNQIPHHKLEAFVLLCPNGSRAELYQFFECNWGVLPSSMVITSIDASEVVRDNVEEFFMEMSSRFHKDATDFRFVGKERDWWKGDTIVDIDTVGYYVVNKTKADIIKDDKETQRLLDVLKECVHREKPERTTTEPGGPRLPPNNNIYIC